MERRSKWLVLLGATALVVTAAWFTWTVMTANSRREPVVKEIICCTPSFLKSYSSVGELSDDSDAVVIGTVKGIAQTGIDAKIPYTVYAVDVLTELKGEVDAVIYVFRSDPEPYPQASLTRLAEGETLALYMSEVSANPASSVTVSDRVYVPHVFDNGVFDALPSGEPGALSRVNDHTIFAPRGTGPSMFAEGTTFTFSELRDAIETGSEEIGPVGSVDE